MSRTRDCSHAGCNLPTKTRQSTMCKLHDPVERDCPVCLSRFNALASNQVYCSRKCQRMKKHQCKTCSVEFLATKRGRLYCSKDCALSAGRCDLKSVSMQVAVLARIQAEIIAIQSKAIARICDAISKASNIKSCKECGETFLASRDNAAYCSKSCSTKEQRRIERKKYKLRKKAAFVESVSPAKVFSKHRWSCALCGISTPMAHRGTYRMDAPELDHIIPISKGGDHSYANTQCLCRGCNAAKSDKVGLAVEGTPSPRGNL